jgi:hypothetical protein
VEGQSARALDQVASLELGDIETGVALADDLFVFRDPRFSPGGRD